MEIFFLLLEKIRFRAKVCQLDNDIIIYFVPKPFSSVNLCIVYKFVFEKLFCFLNWPYYDVLSGGLSCLKIQ